MELITQALKLANIPASSLRAYSDKSNDLLNRVNEAIKSHAEINRLLGSNSFSLLENNHKNHVSFMEEVIKTNNFSLLAETLPWVYRAYHNQGIDYDYFLIEINAWIDAIQNELDSHLAEPIINLYQWMLSQHENIIELSIKDDDSRSKIDDKWAGSQAEFMKALTASDHNTCLAVCKLAKDGGISLPDMFQWIIYPSMVEVGDLWEAGKLSVAEEHAATAIVNTVLSVLYFEANIPKGSKGVALVSASPNERHEMGAWMVAICLELDGWDVVYLGADLPAESIAEAAIKHKVALVALSVAMPFNLVGARAVIDLLRSSPKMNEIKIMLGGSFFVRFPFLADDIGADVCLSDCLSATEWARENA